MRNLLADRPIIGRGKRRVPKRPPVFFSGEEQEAALAADGEVAAKGSADNEAEAEVEVDTTTAAATVGGEEYSNVEALPPAAERQLPSTEDENENAAVVEEVQPSVDPISAPSSAPDNSPNVTDISSPHVVASTAVEKPKVGKLNKSLFLAKKPTPPAETMVTPERQRVLELSSNKHVSNRVGKFLEFTPEQEADRAAASAASAERFSDKRAILDSQAAEAERVAAEDAAVAAGELTAAEREKRQKKRAAVRKHAKKVALAKKTALEAEAAHLAAEEDITGSCRFFVLILVWPWLFPWSWSSCWSSGGHWVANWACPWG